MTRRRILNVTSTKKRDNAITIAIDDDATDTGVLGNPYTMTGDNIYGFLWSPSARVNRVELNEVSRNLTDTYVPGFKERIELITNSGAAWQWRRIVFAMKGPEIRNAFPIGTLYQQDNTSGVQRAVWNFLGSGADAEPSRASVEGPLFRGTSNVDWSDRMTAKIDTTRVTLLSDNMRQLLSGNDNGRHFTSARWIPVRKRVVYDEDESGQNKTLEAWSTSGKPGIGDIYIYDAFRCAGGTNTDELSFNPQCTYYWHER